MLKKSAIFSIFIILLNFNSFSEVFKISYIPDKASNVKAYRKDDGRYLWRSTFKSEVVDVNRSKMLRITEDGSGTWGGKDGLKWHSEAYYTYENERAVPHHTEAVFYDVSGVTVESVKKTYSLDDRKVFFIKNGEKREFDFENDLIDKELLGTAIMNSDLTRRPDFGFNMLTNEPVRYRMALRNLGIQTVLVQGNGIRCYKVQLIPDLGFLGIFATFVPKSYFWYKADPPHDFVKYEGLESGLDSPNIIMEAGD